MSKPKPNTQSIRGDAHLTARIAPTPATCFCGEDLNYAGECWQGMVTGGHRGNCVICGTNADLDMLRCCSAECDQIAEVRSEILTDDEIPF